MSRAPFALVSLATAVLLAACGDRTLEIVPPPLAKAPPKGEGPPDTRSMGAGPAVVANCGLKRGEDLLAQINAARAAARRCGGRSMGAAGPLAWNPTLSTAAASHSQDMAKRNYFDHRSPEGRSVSYRASASGYGWKTVGENIAGGQTSPDEVMREWLASPGHCENIMEPQFSEVAVACVGQPGSQYGTYWTMVLGRPR